MQQDIHFLDYRKRPIEHLVAICKDQHGLVLNNTMGTGKTFTATLFLANFSTPPFKHIIIAPEGTNVEWGKTIKTVGKTNLAEVTFVPMRPEAVFALADTYQDPSWFIIVVDEAHNLVRMLTDPKTNLSLKEKTLSWFSRCKKLLLLSGTPFSSSVEDIGSMVNLAAGKAVMPTTYQDFREKYFTLNKTKAGVFGWILPITTKTASIMIMHSFAPLLIMLILFLLYFQYSTYSNSKALRESIFKIINKDLSTMFLSTEGVSKKKALEDLSMEIATLKKDEEMSKSSLGKLNIIAMEKMHFILSLAITLPRTFAAVLVLYVCIALIGKVQLTRDVFDLNVKNVAKDISPYISTYNPFITQDVEMLKHFPQSKEHIKYTKLNSLQMQFLYKLLTGKLSSNDILNAGIVTSLDELHSYRTSKTLDYFKDVGRLAGGAGDLPPKIAEIFAMHRKQKVPTLIYSNFVGGMLKFCKCARKAGFSTATVPTEQAQGAEKKRLIDEAVRGNLDFLCLPHFAIEGTDVPSMRRFHILEPCLDIIQYRQLIARVIRYQHEIQKPYTVDIYTWVAKMPMLGARIREFFKYWMKFGAHHVPWLFEDDMSKYESPDNLAIKDLRKSSNIFSAIQQNIMRIGGSKTSVAKDLSCCVFNPNEPCKNETCSAFYEKERKASLREKTS
jgi:hypothetical protein